MLYDYISPAQVDELEANPVVVFTCPDCGAPVDGELNTDDETNRENVYRLYEYTGFCWNCERIQIEPRGVIRLHPDPGDRDIRWWWVCPTQSEG